MFLYVDLIEEPRHQSLFASLYQTYRTSMLYIARDVLHDYHWAEDAVSEAFLKIAKNIRRIDELPEEDRKSYLVILTRNAALDLYRQRQAQEIPVEFDENLTAGEVSLETESRVMEQEGYLRMVQVLKQLPVAYRDTFLLYYIHGHTTAEIADLLGVKENTVHARLSRGRSKLKEILEKEGTLS